MGLGGIILFWQQNLQTIEPLPPCRDLIPNAPIISVKTINVDGIICNDLTNPTVCNCDQPNVAKACFIIVIKK